MAFDQVTPLGELTVRWTGTDEGSSSLDEFDEESKPEPEDGEAPVVSDETPFLDPGQSLTAEDDPAPHPAEDPTETANQ